MKHIGKAAVPVLLAVLLLCGCGNRRERHCRELAEDYLSTLAGVVGDTLRLEEWEPEQYGEMYAFLCQSERYGDIFRVYVNSNDAVMDTYFSLDLAESAQRECEKFLAETPVSVSLVRTLATSALSGRRFESVYEAQSCCPDVILLEIEAEPLSEQALTVLLKAIRESGLSARVTLRGEGAVYEVSGGELYRLTSAADGGAYVAKQPLP